MKLFLLILLVIVFFTLDQCLAASNITNVDTCCAACLAQSGVKGLDALDFSKCSSGNSDCCFEDTCHQSTVGSFSFDADSVSYNDGNPVASTGTWINFQWEKVERVTYIVLQEGQPKTSQPKYASAIAKQSNDWFSICASSPGSVYFRGWLQNGCTASIEYQVNVKKSASSSSECSAANRPSPVSPDIQCNLNRASIIDGKCVCASDRAGAPECAGLPAWKWIITIGGGVAAAISIAVSVHTYMRKRKRKENRDSIKLEEAPTTSYNNTPSKSTAAPVTEFTL